MDTIIRTKINMKKKKDHKAHVMNTCIQCGQETDIHHVRCGQCERVRDKKFIKLDLVETTLDEPHTNKYARNPER